MHASDCIAGNRATILLTTASMAAAAPCLCMTGLASHAVASRGCPQKPSNSEAQAQGSMDSHAPACAGGGLAISAPAAVGTPAAAAVVSAMVRAAAPPLRACQPGCRASLPPTHCTATQPAAPPMPTCTQLAIACVQHVIAGSNLRPRRGRCCCARASFARRNGQQRRSGRAAHASPTLGGGLGGPTSL